MANKYTDMTNRVNIINNLQGKSIVLITNIYEQFGLKKGMYKIDFITMKQGDYAEQYCISNGKTRGYVRRKQFKLLTEVRLEKLNKLRKLW